VDSPRELAQVKSLKPWPQRDREAMASTVQYLTREHEAGHLRELVFVSFDAQADVNLLVSGNMSVAHLALAIAYLQEMLTQYLRRAGDRAPPIPIA